MDLDTDLPALARCLGADYYGVADLDSAQDFIHAQGGERVARYPRAVVMGIRLLDTARRYAGGPGQTCTGAALYRHNSYDVVNAALDAMALRMANTIQREGYRALPGPGLETGKR